MSLKYRSLYKFCYNGFVVPCPLLAISWRTWRFQCIFCYGMLPRKLPYGDKQNVWHEMKLV